MEGDRQLFFYTESYQKYNNAEYKGKSINSSCIFHRARYLLHLSVNYHRFQLLPGPPTELCANDDALTPTSTHTYNGEAFNILTSEK